VKLGRVSDMLETDKELKRKRKAFDTDEGAVLGKGDKDDGGGGGGGGEGEAKGVEKVRRKKGDEEGGERKKRKKKKDAVGDDASPVMGDE
jgi:transcription initiation factor TFIID subunit 13